METDENRTQYRIIRAGVFSGALAAAAAVGWMAFFSPSWAAQGERPLHVFVSVPPHAYLVERIGGDEVKVEELVPAGQDPHTFEPTPSQVVALARARLFFQVGMPFERRLVARIAASHAGLEVVDTRAGIELLEGVCTICAEGQPHGTPHHHHGEPDPHIWLSPPLLKAQATTIADALCRVDPDRAASYRRNLAALIEELDDLDGRIGAELEPYRGRAFYVFHPAFGYFAAAYGLRQEAVEVEGKNPTPRQLRELIRRAQADGVEVLFVQPQFDTSAAEVVAEAIGGRVEKLDDLAPDLTANLERIAERIASSMP